MGYHGESRGYNGHMFLHVQTSIKIYVYIYTHVHGTSWDTGMHNQKYEFWVGPKIEDAYF